MTYIWVYCAAVPRANRDSYIRHAEQAGRLFKLAGALSVQENWATDVPDGKITSFPIAVRKEDDEDVVIGWVVWPDKATADRCMAAMENDPKWQDIGDIPFDGKRMIFGSFEPVLSL